MMRLGNGFPDTTQAERSADALYFSMDKRALMVEFPFRSVR